MCEPTTILAGAALVGAGVSIYGQIQQGKAAERQASQEATILGYRERDAKQQGAYEAARILQEGKRVSQSALAAITASGIDTTTGSAANLVTTSNINAAVDAARAKSNAARAAWGFSTDATQARAQGAAARQASLIGAAGTALSGVAQAGSIYYQGYKES